MNIKEINKPVTAKALNESLAKKFGMRVKLEDFTLEQLQDARNKIRTKLSQVETNESFDSVHHNENYQKQKMFLDVLNAEVAERSQVSEAKKKMVKGPDGKMVPDYAADGKGKDDLTKKGKSSKPKKGEVPPQFKKKMKEADTPNLDRSLGNMDKFYGVDDGSGVGPRNLGFSPNAAIRKALAKAIYSAMKAAGVEVEPAKVKQAAKSAAKTMSESVLREGEEDKAELIMAAKDMVDRITGWMEDTAEMQAESMLELGDAIRDELGQQESDEFINSIKPALEALYTSLESTRTTLTSGVAMLTGEAQPAQPMGDEEELPVDEPEMEPTVDDEEGAADEFAASEPAAGGEEEAGRARRESIERSRRLGTILSSKKK